MCASDDHGNEGEGDEIGDNGDDNGDGNDTDVGIGVGVGVDDGDGDGDDSDGVGVGVGCVGDGARLVVMAIMAYTYYMAINGIHTTNSVVNCHSSV